MNATGRILTFYSYKGGTGRSMALANVAWILAANGRRVLCIDWDLEAPGLHRYFAPFLIDPDLFSSDGLIDYVWTTAQAVVTPSSAADRSASGAPTLVDAGELADIGDYTIRLDWDFPGDGVLDLIPAGRQGPSYAERVNTFDWDQFYERLGGGRVLNGLREQLCREYDFVLIDSRTGVSDTSGICTVQLPDALVVLFTLNKQSMRGAEAIAQSVREQRSDMPIFPVPTRVDPFEAAKLRAALRMARSTFAPFVGDLIASGSMRTEASAYWGDVEVPYIPFFAYEEVLAPFADERGRRSTLLSSATRLAAHITGEPMDEPLPIPDEVRENFLREFAHDGEAARLASQGATAAAAQADIVHVTAVKPVQKRTSRRVWIAVAVAAVALLASVSLMTFSTGAPPRAASLAMLSLSSTPADRKQSLLQELYDQSRSLDGADLAGADLSSMRLIGIELRNANLAGARLVNAVLDSADLSGADLRGADLTNASLHAAQLSGAQLARANLSGSNLYAAALSNVAFDSVTTNALTILSDSTPGPYTTDEDIAVHALPRGQVSSAIEAFIWIGNYDRKQGQWEKSLLADSTNTAVAIDPERLRVGGTYHVLGNLTARESMPRNDAAYFSSITSLGWVPRGSPVTLLDAPREFVRPTGLRQYWAHVSVDSVRQNTSSRRVRLPDDAALLRR